MRTFEEIYRIEKPKVYRMLLVKVYPNKELAEELTNNVFVNVNDHLESFNSDISAFDTWLFNITKNVLIDYFRSKASNWKLNKQTGEVTKKMNVSNIESYVNSEGDEYFEVPTYDKIFELSDQSVNAKVERILATVKNKEAVAVTRMRLYEGISFDEISKALGLSVVNAKVMFSRVREKLQNELQTSYAM